MDPKDYLPKFLQDFHDQKDVFKLIEQTIISRRQSGHDRTNYPNWVDAQIYTIDIFLWTMGFYGYKLQKMRRKGKYGDLPTDINKMNRKKMENLNKFMRQANARAKRT